MKKAIKYILIICSLNLNSFASDTNSIISQIPRSENPEQSMLSITSTSIPTLPDITQEVQEKRIGTETSEEKVQEIVKEPAEKLSSFETYIQKGTVSSISTDINQFGYDLFRKSPTTFAPVDNIPVSPDYLLGPGDEIKIAIWGKIRGDYIRVIDREGKINISEFGGILQLSGLTFGEAKDFLEKELSRYYRASEIKMSVSLGKLRSINIYVVGNVQKPGTYTLSSLSTLINALFASGGPNKIGTMRDIQLKRNGEIITHFDLYDFLLAGDKTKDAKLMPEDVVFVPTSGPVVAISGNVKVPAIYELKDETKILDLINMASGLSVTAFNGRIQIQRILDHKVTTLFEEDLIDIENNPDKNFILKDGDFAKIFSVIDTKNTITISGAVANPGEYAVIDNVTKISDVISKAGGLLYYATDDAELTRLNIKKDGPETERFVINIKKAISGDPQNNLTLKTNDYIFIRTIPNWQLHRIVTITGEVKFAGTYTIMKGEKLSSLIERAGGFTDRAFVKGAVFTRESVRILQQKQLDEAIDRIEKQILSSGATTIETAITAESGALKAQAAEQRRALITKMRTARAQGRIAIKLDTMDKFKNSFSDIILENNDVLNIPEQPEQVNIIGSVYNQTSFVYDPKAKVSSYINKAGGITSGADEDELFVLKIDGTAISDREVNGFFTRGLKSHKLDPGDTIVVPEKVERIAWLREIKDITQIIFQLAVTTGVVVALF